MINVSFLTVVVICVLTLDVVDAEVGGRNHRDSGRSKGLLKKCTDLDDFSHHRMRITVS